MVGNLGEKQRRSLAVCFEQIQRGCGGSTWVDDYEAEHGPDIGDFLDKALRTDAVTRAQVEAMIRDYQHVAQICSQQRDSVPHCIFHLTSEPVGHLSVRWPPKGRRTEGETEGEAEGSAGGPRKGGAIPGLARTRMTPQGSWYQIVRFEYEMNYGLSSRRYREWGKRFHLAAADVKSGTEAARAALRATAAAATAAGAAGGTVVVPGVGTVAVGALCAAIGGTLSELGGILLEVLGQVGSNADGSVDFWTAPHGLGAGNVSVDPNVVLGPLWSGTRADLDRLNKLLGGQRRPGGTEGAESVEADTPAEATTSEGRLIDESALSIEPGASPAGTKTEGEGDGAPSRKGAQSGRRLKRGATVQGRLEGGAVDSYELDMKEGDSIECRIYARLPADASSASATFAVQDEEGGVLQRARFQVTDTGEDWTREDFDFTAEETAKHRFRIRSEDQDSEPIEYKIKIA